MVGMEIFGVIFFNDLIGLYDFRYDRRIHIGWVFFFGDIIHSNTPFHSGFMHVAHIGKLRETD
jgi:hypothetical protein